MVPSLGARWRASVPLCVALWIALVPAGAWAEAEPKPAEAGTRAPAPAQPELPVTSDAEALAATELLAVIGAGGPAGPRQDAAKELAELAPRAMARLAAELTRPRASSVELRRAVLTAIEAAVPDASGKFVQPKRQKTSELRADDEIDWLAALLALAPERVEVPTPEPKRSRDDDEPAPTPAPAPDPAAIAKAISEVIVDVAVVRALSAAHDWRAAAPIFAAAFDDATMIYRDECGRYLRKMEPWSIPVLTRESQGQGDRRRYATYQLERLDRQEPNKALTAAIADEALTVAVLDAFRQTRHREAVYAVFSYIDRDAPRVRKAARDAWLAYVTGKPPPPAPKRKMVLPGGKLADKATPEWLTYRELADAQLRKASAELLGEELPERPAIDVEALSLRIFDHYDQIRAKREAEQWKQAQALATGGDVPGAIARIDALLAVNPDRSERAEMATLYLRHAKALQGQDKWSEAASAFSMAHGLSPDGPGAKEAAAGRDFALGKAMEAQGKDGTGLYRRAAVTKPDFEEAAQAAAGGQRPRWMLLVAAAAGLLAVGLLALGVARRRRVA
jgi:tetratricopeptide (TPR) repeat protein